jgi:hypothetical protein
MTNNRDRIEVHMDLDDIYPGSHPGALILQNGLGAYPFVQVTINGDLEEIANSLERMARILRNEEGLKVPVSKLCDHVVGIYCYCIRPKGHEGDHECEHG